MVHISPVKLGREHVESGARVLGMINMTSAPEYFESRLADNQ